MSQLRVLNLDAVQESPIEGEGAVGTFGLPLLPLSEGAGTFDVRAVRIAAGGISPAHSHAWEQANYVLEGTGEVEVDGQTRQVTRNDFVWVPPDAHHVFRNTGAGDLVLLAVRGPGA